MPEPSGGPRIEVDGATIVALPGETVAAALLRCGRLRRSVTGEPRAPLCGMGSCYECRARVDGVALVRTCLTAARDGMVVRLDA
jgi:sarcosine oxidase subunit alpha